MYTYTHINSLTKELGFYIPKILIKFQVKWPLNGVAKHLESRREKNKSKQEKKENVMVQKKMFK